MEASGESLEESVSLEHEKVEVYECECAPDDPYPPTTVKSIGKDETGNEMVLVTFPMSRHRLRVAAGLVESPTGDHFLDLGDFIRDAMIRQVKRGTKALHDELATPATMWDMLRQRGEEEAARVVAE